MSPQRIQLSRKKGFRLQEMSMALNGLSAVNVARPSRHGNPFRVGGYFMIGDPGGHRGPFRMVWCESFKPDPKFTLIQTNEQSVEFFRAFRLTCPLSPREIAELRGENLACWCAIGAPCHGDTLLELANQ